MRLVAFVVACSMPFGSVAAAAQEAQEPVPEPVEEQAVDRRVTRRVPRTSQTIVVDGVLDEPAWDDAVVITLDYEWFPGDGVRPPVDTEALVVYDDQRLYMGFRAFDPEPEKIRAHLMDRDQINTFVQDDHLLVMLDTFNDERRAFQFRINPLGVQADAIFSEVDGIEDFSWDMIWQSAGNVTDEGFVVEIALPFDQLRFQGTHEDQTWGLELGRSWPRSTRHRIADAYRDRGRSCIICQFNKIDGLEGLEPGKNLELDPTLTAVRTDTLDEYPDGDFESEESADVGLTVRWGITPNMTLLGTVNPDFSQVEADVAQLDVNERFALFFEERRPFFLEGLDFFSTPINAVYTRTVFDPDWGAKVTGKTGRNALGAHVVQDASNGIVIPSNQTSEFASLEGGALNSVFRYRRDVGETSTLGILYTGREGDGYHNRVAGLDGYIRLGRADTVAFQYLRSQTLYPETIAEEYDQSSDTFTGDAWEIEYDHNGRNWNWEARLENRSPGFRVDSGFVPRVDIKEGEAALWRTLWGDDGTWYDQIAFGGGVERTEDHEGQLTDEELELFANFRGPLQSFLELSLERNKEFFDGTLYEGMHSVDFFFQMQPGGALKIECFGLTGDTVDVANNQPADELLLNPAIEAKLGRHVNLRFDHTFQRLDVEGGELFQANLSQLRLVYNFSVRSFVRGIFQYLDLDQNPDLYEFPVASEQRTLFTQLLFSYKLNARTVLFAGYSDNSLGVDDITNTRTNRTFFLKLGYAWIL